MEQQIGFLQSAFNKLVARRVQVREVEAVTDRYRVVTLAGDDLRDRAWIPGQMVQLAFAGWGARAYTPFLFADGALSLLGFAHGGGAGSEFLTTAAPGDERYLVGPRGGVRLDARPLLFFGDETSISTAAAICGDNAAVVLEVDDVASARVACDRLDVRATLVPRGDAETVLDILRAVPDSHLVLTGRAASIQRLHRAAGLPRKQVTTCAYWSPGRKGFSGVQR